MLDRVKSPVHWGKRLVSFERAVDDEKIRLEFDSSGDNDATEVDLLVGADGIKSCIIKKLEMGQKCCGLRNLEIMIILGIADFCDPLLDERGFYTLDGTHRLFTMPYEGSKLSTTQRRTMWQLSYRLQDEKEQRRLSVAGPEALRDEVMRRCRNWHHPVCDMIAATPLETIWGT
jgi:2-polyprenyl-6-methoxyphenol hydroxylase-like FAD-dependent oxidoreductase